jgi:hypothetical protein
MIFFKHYLFILMPEASCLLLIHPEYAALCMRLQDCPVQAEDICTLKADVITPRPDYHMPSAEGPQVPGCSLTWSREAVAPTLLNSNEKNGQTWTLG